VNLSRASIASRAARNSGSFGSRKTPCQSRRRPRRHRGRGSDAGGRPPRRWRRRGRAYRPPSTGTTSSPSRPRAESRPWASGRERRPPFRGLIFGFRQPSRRLDSARPASRLGICRYVREGSTAAPCNRSPVCSECLVVHERPSGYRTRSRRWLPQTLTCAAGLRRWAGFSPHSLEPAHRLPQRYP